MIHGLNVGNDTRTNNDRKRRQVIYSTYHSIQSKQNLTQVPKNVVMFNKHGLAMDFNGLGHVESNYQSNSIWLLHAFITCAQRPRTSRHDCAALQYFWEIK